jgi:hypothetical protein
MKKFTIWSANTNSDFQEARENGALYPVVLPDNVSVETVTRLLETVGDCYNGDKKTFQFEWEKVPDAFALFTYTQSTEDLVRAGVGVFPLFDNRSTHDLKESDFIQFVRSEVNVLSVRPVKANGRTTFHYFNSQDQQCILEITKTKTITPELAEQLKELNL